eukprot:5677070-Amphidinium_carterae.1
MERHIDDILGHHGIVAKVSQVCRGKVVPEVINQCLEALQYIEDMMQKQLVAALGKEITPGAPI